MALSTLESSNHWIYLLLSNCESIGCLPFDFNDTNTLFQVKQKVGKFQKKSFLNPICQTFTTKNDIMGIDRAQTLHYWVIRVTQPRTAGISHRGLKLVFSSP